MYPGICLLQKSVAKYFSIPRTSFRVSTSVKQVPYFAKFYIAEISTNAFIKLYQIIPSPPFLLSR